MTKEYPGYKVNPVDTTGAGDAFAAGFIYGRVNQWNLDKIVIVPIVLEL